MTKKRKIIDARKAPDGTISAVRIEGNKTFTSKERAFGMAKSGKVDLVPIQGGHVRTRPDNTKKNNLGDMAN